MKGCHSLAPHVFVFVVMVINKNSSDSSIFLVFDQHARKLNKKGSGGVRQEKNDLLRLLRGGGALVLEFNGARSTGCIFSTKRPLVCQPTYQSTAYVIQSNMDSIN